MPNAKGRPGNYRSRSSSFGTTSTKTSYRGRGRKANKFVKSKRSYQKNKKLLDKKINTLVESRMQEIAKDEIDKNLKVLTSRKYLFTRYNPTNNEYSPLVPPSDLIDWNGHVVELSNIPKTDIETRGNLPQLNDLLTSINEQTGDNDGTNQLMIGDPMNGYRWSDIIYIRSVSAQLRIRSFELQEDIDLDIFGTVKVKYAFIMVTDEQDVMYDPLEEPEANQMLRMDPWGYKSSLDTDLALVFNSLKSRILCQGETTLVLNDSQTSEKYTTIYKKFNKPIQLVYKADDQNGQRVNKKIYFVTRSSVPANAAYNGVKPSLFACTKINYYEA